MSGYEEPKETPKAPVVEPPKSEVTPPVVDAKGDSDDGVDQFGYEKTKAESGKSEPVKESVKAEPEVIAEASGYEKEPEAPAKEEPKVDPPVADKKAADAPKDEFEIAEPGDLVPEEVAQLKAFVKENKVPKEIAEALVKQRKAEVVQFKEMVEKQKKAREANELKQKREWYDELKNDPDFGKEKFDQNRKTVDKVLANFLPNLKKKLTDSKGMLPPYVMRDLAKLGKHLYSTESLVEGDPPTKPDDNKGEKNNPLDFYS
jgi:hypothetical protein